MMMMAVAFVAGYFSFLIFSVFSFLMSKKKPSAVEDLQQPAVELPSINPAGTVQDNLGMPPVPTMTCTLGGAMTNSTAAVHRSVIKSLQNPQLPSSIDELKKIIMNAFLIFDKASNNNSATTTTATDRVNDSSGSSVDMSSSSIPYE
jgi:hypothetical protein